MSRAHPNSRVESYFRTLAALTREAEATDADGRALSLEEAFDTVRGKAHATHDAGGKLLFIGNGGSAAIASHLAIDYSKNGGLRSLALNDAATLTCLGNDLGYENVFAKQLELHARPGDLLIAISSSGRSPNILAAVATARAGEAGVVTLSGFAGGNDLRRLGDINFYVRSSEYGFVEVAHLSLCHAIAAEAGTREPQYNRCLEIDAAHGRTPLGLMTNQVWYDDPRRLTFLLARYKFVAKMLAGRGNIAEVGCGDAFGTRIVLQAVERVTAYDFDPVFIADVRRRFDPRWPIEAHVHDALAGPLPARYDGIYSLDVLEHIARADEQTFIANLAASLGEAGTLIIGTPSLESQAHASPPSKAGHVNCKSGDELKALLERTFHNVYLFAMNDEVVHTGFAPMAHYLFAVCTGRRAPPQD